MNHHYRIGAELPAPRISGSAATGILEAGGTLVAMMIGIPLVFIGGIALAGLLAGKDRVY
jgi:hypothetical protein